MTILLLPAIRLSCYRPIFCRLLPARQFVSQPIGASWHLPFAGAPPASFRPSAQASPKREQRLRRSSLRPSAPSELRIVCWLFCVSQGKSRVPCLARGSDAFYRSQRRQGLLDCSLLFFQLRDDAVETIHPISASPFIYGSRHEQTLLNHPHLAGTQPTPDSMTSQKIAEPRLATDLPH